MNLAVREQIYKTHLQSPHLIYNTVILVVERYIMLKRDFFELKLSLSTKYRGTWDCVLPSR